MDFKGNKLAEDDLSMATLKHRKMVIALITSADICTGYKIRPYLTTPKIGHTSPNIQNKTTRIKLRV